MKLEAGKEYLTECGKKATVMAIAKIPSELSEFVIGRVDGCSTYIHWYGDGSGPRNRCGQRIQEYWITGPWVDPPKAIGLIAKIHANGKVDLDLDPLNKALSGQGIKKYYGVCCLDDCCGG